MRYKYDMETNAAMYINITLAFYSQDLFRIC